jgi:hypothetical protein
MNFFSRSRIPSLAGAGMAAFACDTMNSAAETGQVATNIRVAADELSTFGRVIERNGGNGESAMASMKGRCPASNIWARARKNS